MNQNFKETLIKLFTIKGLKDLFYSLLFTIIFISVSLTNVYLLQKIAIQKEVSFEYKNIDTMLEEK
jgi:hypothetical protein